jgi:peptide/nickel transport system substrate-binding protein
LDPDLKIVPDLAESWKVVDALTWEFKLRKGVTFHNGEPFNAAAAAYSLKRAKTHKKSQFKAVVPNYKELIVVDEHTLRVVTVKPEPEALLMLTNISMVPPKYFTDQKDTYLAAHPVGTGAYKFVEWVKDDHIELIRNDGWHHGKVDYQRVLIRPIPEDATRVAALVSGEIDVCWGVPIPDIPRVEKNKDTYIDRCPSARVIYLMFDVFNDKGGAAPKMQPGLPDGKPNPFKDIRVRKAIAHGINIKDVIEYVMEGSAYPATQIVSSYSPGFNPDIKQAAYDPDTAKKLLAEAGYADGFKANFDSPNDRYINDQQVAEAITAQLKKIGIQLNLVAQPKAVFFPKISKYKSPMFLVGWGMLSWTGTMNNFFRERISPYGRNNRGRYIDKALEARIEEANTTMDDAKREKLRHAIMADAMASYYALPLYYQENVNGYGNRVKGKARVDEYIYAYEIKKAK